MAETCTVEIVETGGLFWVVPDWSDDPYVGFPFTDEGEARLAGMEIARGEIGDYQIGFVAEGDEECEELND